MARNHRMRWFATSARGAPGDTRPLVASAFRFPQPAGWVFRGARGDGTVFVMKLPDEAQALAIRQYGVVARHQLRQWMTLPQIDGLVQRGYLVPIERGVYRVFASAIPPEQAAMAAILRTRPARLAGPFVLGLYGAEGFSRTNPFTVLVAPGRRPRKVGFRVSRDPCPDQHHATWDGVLPVVNPTLASIDGAHPHYRIGDKALRVAIDSLRWSRRTTTRQLDLVSAALPRHPGARRIRRMVDDLTLISESEPERQFGGLLDQLTPRPQRQVPIAGYRVDFAWPHLRVIVEYDGEVHDRPDRRQADAQRDRDLEAAGYLVVRVRAADLRDPDRLLRRLHHTMRARAAELGVTL
jgi:very-short-patch-repair endonuclease